MRVLPYAVAVNNLISNGFSLHIVPQNLYELWVIATRPASQNGFGMSTAATYQLVKKCIEQFSLLKDEKNVFDHWLKLVHDQGVQGKNAHDARLVAAMINHGISDLVTFNTDDFKRFPINVQNPAQIASSGIQQSSQD